MHDKLMYLTLWSGGWAWVTVSYFYVFSKSISIKEIYCSVDHIYILYMFLSCFYARIRQFVTCYYNFKRDWYTEDMKNECWLLIVDFNWTASLPGISHCRKSSKNWTLELFLFTTYWIKYWTNKEWCSTFESHADSKYQGKQGSVSSPTPITYPY